MNAPPPPGITTPVKAYPLRFSAPMVNALLAGRKTQTRRVAKLTDSGRVKAVGSPRNWHVDDPNAVLACPYGRAGDLLWVRESWRTQSCACDDLAPSQMSGEEPILYAADLFWELNKSVGRVRAAMHMPRWASRLTLRITDVRVQRLQEVSDHDVAAEGVEPFGKGCGVIDRKKSRAYTTLRGAFSILWDDINGPGAWARNPLVWALTFEVLPGNIAKWAPA